MIEGILMLVMLLTTYLILLRASHITGKKNKPWLARLLTFRAEEKKPAEPARKGAGGRRA